MAVLMVLAMIFMIGWLGSAALPPGETVTVTFTGGDFYVPRPVEASDQENVERLLDGTFYDFAANGHEELIGMTCTVSRVTVNGESVHVNNYGVFRSNGDSITLTGTEDEVNGVRLSSQEITLGPVAALYNVMVRSDDGKIATSVDYTITITCTGETVEETTTTTAAESTTTTEEETTSTTQPPTTTTSAPSTTTSTQPTTTTTEASTTTTSPDSSTTSSSTTVPNETTTTIPETTTTTGGGSTSTTTPESTSSTDTTVPPTTETTLPFTGFDTALMGGIAVVLVLAGVLVLGIVDAFKVTRVDA